MKAFSGRVSMLAGDPYYGVLFLSRKIRSIGFVISKKTSSLTLLNGF